jgi:putative hydrolase of the HAD superfamily
MLKEEYMNMESIKAIVFDWGDTLMMDSVQYSGPMVEWPEVNVIPGVKEVLPQICDSFICCVATNAGASDANLVRLAFARVGIEKYFKEFFTSQELGAKKPDKKFFEEILKRLNLKPYEVIMVGNDYDKDIKPAKLVGMRTILYSEIKEINNLQYADFIISKMDELNSTVNKLLYI